MSDLETVEAFRERARTWIRANLEKAKPERVRGRESDDVEAAKVNRDREIQRMLFDAGLAGICVPTEYGGQGLTYAHQLALNEELSGYEHATFIQVPTMTPCMAVLLDFASEEIKKRHVPRILRGEEIWMQFLSEPSGGSDVAGAQTTAVRDGDEWVLNGSKIWTTGAWWSDWAICLARTNWDVPKHRGLTVFIVPIRHPGIEVQRIEMLNGSKEFCQEFISDARIPDEWRIGEVDQGWTVGTRWMYHERTVGGGSAYVTRPAGGAREGRGVSSTAIAKLAIGKGTIGDGHVRQLIGENLMMSLVGPELIKRVAQGIRLKKTSDQAAAIGRLWTGVSSVRSASIAYEVASAGTVAWDEEDLDYSGEYSNGFIMRQAACIAGGTTEMARNGISERVLGMPRDRTFDRDMAFRDVPRSAPTK
ncbi:MAG: acyl-CoA dehydrogenase family protein [Acidimicrobiia bacterium]